MNIRPYDLGRFPPPIVIGYPNCSFEGSQMRRREFIAGLGRAAVRRCARWRRAQQAGPVRSIGVLMGWSESDPDIRADFAAFVAALAQLGWTVGGNLLIEQRWTNAEFARIAPFAHELVALRPDMILASTTPVTAALRRETRGP